MSTTIRATWDSVPDAVAYQVEIELQDAGPVILDVVVATRDGGLKHLEFELTQRMGQQNL